MPTSRRSAPRSLAEDLRSREDDDLAALLVARPDLANPVPSGTSALAARASTRVSVHRALAELDSPTIQVAQAMAALGSPTSSTAVSTAVIGTVGPAVERLQALGLVWGSPRELHLVRAVSDLLGSYPAGLGPRLADLVLARSPRRLAAVVADAGLAPTGDPSADLAALVALLSDPAELRRLLHDAPPGSTELLALLDGGHPVGAVPHADRAVRAADANGSVEWLLARGVIVAVDAEHVVLPREVGLGLRNGRVHERLLPEPDLQTRDRGADRVDSVASSAGAEAVRLVEQLGLAWGTSPSPVLRSGGVGVRELRRTAVDLDASTEDAALVIEIAYAAGLVADDGALQPHWAPTPGFDEWAAADVSTQWVRLAEAWLRTPRAPALTGTRDERGTVRAPLSDSLIRASAPTLRAVALGILVSAGPGQAVESSSLTAVLAWRRPRATPPGGGEDPVDELLREAAWLGLVGLGAASTAAAALLADEPTGQVVAAMAAALPRPVDHVLLQADLTAVAPGPLEPALAAELALVADVDSRGGATVYRFGPGTVRRALDAGRSAADVLSFLAEHSRTPVPQPLEYLVADTARRHGRIRVGAAGAYLRSDDEAVLTELLADRRAATLRLRRLAPTVLSSAGAPGVVLEVLRDMGLAPAAEGEDGSVLIRRATAHRTPPRAAPVASGRRPPPLDDELARDLVRTLRSRDEVSDGDARQAARSAVPPVPSLDPAVSLAILRDAAADRRTVWVAVADSSGRVTRQLVEPLTVDGGRVTVLDHGQGVQRTLSVHRLTGVVHAGGGAGKP